MILPNLINYNFFIQTNKESLDFPLIHLYLYSYYIAK